MDKYFLTVDQWLDFFNLQPINLNTFKTTATVSYKTTTPLKDFIKKHNKKKPQNTITDKEIELLYYYAVTNRETYLRNFYRQSLKISDNTYMENVPLTICTRKNSHFKNIIRNMYVRELLLETTCDMSVTKPFLKMLMDLFNHQIIDYKLLTRSAIGLMKKKKFGVMVSGYYFRSSILNPAAIHALSKEYFGEKVFTPTLGWSSYLYGSLCNKNVKEYVGTDVIEKVCTITQEFATAFFPEKSTTIYCCPSEKLLNDSTFNQRNFKENYFDTIFFSPPYFKLEMYPGKLQSIVLYPNYNDWLEKYWRQTIKLCRKIIKPTGKLIYIISNYGKQKSLCEDMNKITQSQFTLQMVLPLNNTKTDIINDNNNKEKIFIFTPCTINNSK